MISTIVLLVTMCVIASALFGIILIIDKLSGTCLFKLKYLLTKITLSVYFFPVFFLVGRNTLQKSRVTRIMLGDETPDFEYLEYVGMLSDKRFGETIYKLFFVIFAVWATGFLISFAVELFQDQGLIWKIVKAGYAFETESREEKMKEVLMNQFHIKRRVLLRKSDIIDSPFTTGIIKIFIILPDKAITEEELNFILRHELIHIKRKDVLFKLFMNFVCGLHWYNPLLSCFKKRFFDFCELTCDEDVVKNFTYEMCNQYSKTIITLSSKKREMKHGSISALTSNHEKFLKRRVENIMKKKTKSLKNVLATGITAGVFFLASPLITYASVNGVFQIYKTAMDSYTAYNTIEEIPNSEMVQSISDNPNIKIVVGSLKGSNSVDVNVAAYTQMNLDSFDLTSGDRIVIMLSDDNSSNKFKAGIIDNSNGTKRSVTSTNGEIDHVFKIAKAATYTVFIENPNNNDIHIVGEIDVKY